MGRFTKVALAIGLTLGGLGGPSLVSAQVKARSLLEPAAKLSRPFNRITGLHELSDGRVVVVDANDESVLLVDFASDGAVQLGRKGSGPGEYRFPMRLLRLGGDSIGIEDGGNGRILVVTAKARLSGILSPFGTRPGSPASARGEHPTASDNQGRLYALAFSPFHPGATQPDSARIERWRVGASAREPVAYVPLLPAELRVTLPGEGTRAFITSPQWAVGPEGQMAIVHPRPYSVHLIDAKGTRVPGQPIPYQRIRVSAEDKRQWRAERSRPVPVTIMTPSGVSSAGLRPMLVQEPVQWPDYLPPFLDHAVRFDPDGLLWIQRTVPAGRPELFDVVDARGRVVEQVSAPARSRIVGFGRSSIYLVRLDPDDQEFLERYTTSARSQAPTPWRVDANPIMRIGGANAGDTLYQLSQVRGAVRLSDGRVVVLEGVELRWYDRSGKHLYTTSRRGGGPGEFRSAQAILRLPGDTVLVVSGRPVKQVFFAPTGKLVREAPVDEPRYYRLRQWAECASLFLPDRSRLACVSLEGAAPAAFDPGPGHLRTFYQVVRVPWSLDSVIPLGRDAGIEQFGLDLGRSHTVFVIHPFHALSYKAAGGTPFRIAIALNPEYRIEIWRPDGVLERTIIRANAQHPPTAEDRAAVPRLLAPYAEMTRVPVDRLLAEVPAPKLLPAIAGLAFAPGGELLVTREGQLPSQRETLVEVLDRKGEQIGTLHLPPRVRILEVGTDYLLGLRFDADDVPSVELYRLQGPERTPF